jgi:hypothetical protein
VIRVNSQNNEIVNNIQAVNNNVNNDIHNPDFDGNLINEINEVNNIAANNN